MKQRYLTGRRKPTPHARTRARVRVSRMAGFGRLSALLWVVVALGIALGVAMASR